MEGRSMTSPAKIEANRRNAQRSTGPRAAPAKARVRLNARRHGLAARVVQDPILTAEVDRVASMLGGPVDGSERQLMLIIAEAQVTLQRVRKARAAILEQMALQSATPPAPDIAPDAPDFQRLLRLERYERGALARRKRAARLLRSRENGEVVPT
jgi:hypothetical protein